MLCFQWTHGYKNAKNVAQVFCGVYFTTNTSGTNHLVKILKPLPRTSRPSTSVNDDNIGRIKETVLYI